MVASNSIFSIRHAQYRGVSLSDDQSDIPHDLHDVSELNDLTAGPVVFRHDNKLFLPGHVHFTKEQVLFSILTHDACDSAVRTLSL